MGEGALGAHFSLVGGPLVPHRTAPALRLTNSLATVKIV